MSDFLQRMIDSSRLRLDRSRSMVSLEQLMERLPAREPRPLETSGFFVIAETKPVSPAEGGLDLGDPVVQARIYESGGASAISVLTEPTEFGGSLGLQQTVANATSLPVLRKDFIVDAYQVWEGRSFGADGVLAIARILDDENLRLVADAASRAGMFLLLEAFDHSDLERIVPVAVDEPNVLVGINSRDLATLEVRRDAHERLIEALPAGTIGVAESGLRTAGDIERVRSMGYRAALVGTALMKATDPRRLLEDMVRAGATSS